MKKLKKVTNIGIKILISGALVVSSSFAVAAADTDLLYPSENADYFLHQVGTAELGTNDKGCHNQGIKFNGKRFFTTCMDTVGNDTARLYVHDQGGNLVKDYKYTKKYDHPSGILLYKDWAYTGFTHQSLNMYTRLFRFNGNGDVQPQGYSSHSVGFVGAKFPFPNDPEFIVQTRYYSYSQYYERQCDGTEGSCDSYTDIKTRTNIGGASEDSVQDCDYYYKGDQWYKACILFSADTNLIRVWYADELVLSPENSITTLAMEGQPGHSGGLGFYTDPNGVKWILTTPPFECNGRTCGGCFLVGGDTCACTDKMNRQRVSFYRFDHLAWPGYED